MYVCITKPPSHDLNQCWFIVQLILENTLQSNFNQNTESFIQEITFEIDVCKNFCVSPNVSKMSTKQ